MVYTILVIAGVMELVDVVDSKSTASDGVPVRVRPPAPYEVVPSFELFYRKAELLFAKTALFLMLFRTFSLSAVLKNAKILKLNIYCIAVFEHLFSI